MPEILSSLGYWHCLGAAGLIDFWDIQALWKERKHYEICPNAVVRSGFISDYVTEGAKIIPSHLLTLGTWLEKAFLWLNFSSCWQKYPSRLEYLHYTLRLPLRGNFSRPVRYGSLPPANYIIFKSSLWFSEQFASFWRLIWVRLCTIDPVFRRVRRIRTRSIRFFIPSVWNNAWICVRW